MKKITYETKMSELEKDLGINLELKKDYTLETFLYILDAKKYENAEIIDLDKKIIFNNN
jgi:hypothetical protein